MFYLIPKTRDEIIDFQKLFLRTLYSTKKEEINRSTKTPIADYLGEEFKPLPPVVITKQGER